MWAMNVGGVIRRAGGGSSQNPEADAAGLGPRGRWDPETRRSSGRGYARVGLCLMSGAERRRVPPRTVLDSTCLTGTKEGQRRAEMAETRGNSGRDTRDRRDRRGNRDDRRRGRDEPRRRRAVRRGHLPPPRMLGREPLPAVTFSTGDVGRTSETVEGSPSPDWPTRCGFEWRPSDGGGLPRPRPSMGGAPDRSILRPSVGSVSVDLRRSTRHGSFRCDISSEWKFNLDVVSYAR